MEPVVPRVVSASSRSKSVEIKSVAVAILTWWMCLWGDLLKKNMFFVAVWGGI